MRRLVTLIAAAAIGLAMPVLAAPGASAASGGSTASMESEFVSRLNSLRSSKGLPPVRVDAELTAIGRRWAGKMAQDGRISHNANYPNEVQQNWVKLGENVGTGPDVKAVHDAFVASQTHYKNMVDGAFTRIGVGVVIGPNGAIYTAHQFMRLASDDSTGGAAPTVNAPAPSPAKSKAKAAPAPAPRKTAPAAARPAPAPAVPAGSASAPAAPVVPVRIALSLEQSQGRGL